MKTTFDSPDDLISEIKRRAAEENRIYEDMFADVLRKDFDQSRSEAPQIRNRVKLPLIRTGHPAKPGEELTPDRISEILLEQEVDDLVR